MAGRCMFARTWVVGAPPAGEVGGRLGAWMVVIGVFAWSGPCPVGLDPERSATIGAVAASRGASPSSERCVVRSGVVAGGVVAGWSTVGVGGVAAGVVAASRGASPSSERCVVRSGGNSPARVMTEPGAGAGGEPGAAAEGAANGAAVAGAGSVRLAGMSLRACSLMGGVSVPNRGDLSLESRPSGIARRNRLAGLA